MHELALMESLLAVVEESAAAHGIRRVTAARLVVGEFTAALPEALEFAFEALSPGTVMDGATLTMTLEEAQARCRACGHEYHPPVYRLACPACGGPPEVLKGKELYLDYYEGE